MITNCRGSFGWTKLIVSGVSGHTCISIALPRLCWYLNPLYPDRRSGLGPTISQSMPNGAALKHWNHYFPIYTLRHRTRALYLLFQICAQPRLAPASDPTSLDLRSTDLGAEQISESEKNWNETYWIILTLMYFSRVSVS